MRVRARTCFAHLGSPALTRDLLLLRVQEQMLADVHAEMLQGRGGLRQGVQRMVMGMDIQIDLDAIRSTAEKWNQQFQADIEQTVLKMVEDAEATVSGAASAALADASSRGAGQGSVAEVSALDGRLGKMEKMWGEERRVILRKLQQLDAAAKDTSTAVAAAAAAATAAAAAATRTMSEGTPPPSQDGSRPGSPVEGGSPPAQSARERGAQLWDKVRAETEPRAALVLLT